MILAADYKRPLDRIESGILTVIALWEKGDKYNAAVEMEQALHIATPYGFIQLFINEGKEILPMLWMIRKKTDIDLQQAEFIDTLTQRISGFDRKRENIFDAVNLYNRNKLAEYKYKQLIPQKIIDSYITFRKPGVNFKFPAHLLFL